jgi:transcriptional regulator with XRE-family HTH domain
MTIYQTQLLNEVGAGHDGPRIPAAKLAYFQERLRGRIFAFILGRFLEEQKNGLTQAKLARRIGKTSDLINRWLGAPSNLTVDTISDLLIGIGAEELNLSSASLLNRAPVNYSHLDDVPSIQDTSSEMSGQPIATSSAMESAASPLEQRVASIQAM